MQNLLNAQTLISTYRYVCKLRDQTSLTMTIKPRTSDAASLSINRNDQQSWLKTKRHCFRVASTLPKRTPRDTRFHRRIRGRCAASIAIAIAIAIIGLRFQITLDYYKPRSSTLSCLNEKNFPIRSNYIFRNNLLTQCLINLINAIFELLNYCASISI